MIIFTDFSGNIKHNFWKGLASKINLEFGTTYTGGNKMQLYIDGQPKGRSSALGTKYYENSVNVFGKNDVNIGKPQTIYDIAHEINTTSHTTTLSSSPLHLPICSPISPLRSHSSSSPTPLRHSSPTPFLRHSSLTPYRL
ncbi:unnamed protein product [Rhizophagus irregularis]|nr:unnamed protein product [Rhizophagus irregularis]